MDVSGWVSESVKNIQQNGLAGTKQSLWPVYRKLIEQGRRFQPPGDNIYDYEWDLLIVVDACRLDLMVEVAGDYNFIDSVDSHWSVDSTTALWMQRTFSSRDTSETSYICSNPFSAEYVNPSDFTSVQEVWRNVWSDPGTVPPRPITDLTIKSMRNNRSPRTIAHYLQPHCPFISMPELSKGKNIDNFGKQKHRDVWELYRDGDISLQDLWQGYRRNLEIVLTDIGVLLNNVSADKVVITSDHGNALGKWGIYGHPPRMPHRSLREVPWIVTSAKDTESYSPQQEYKSNEKIDREEQLKALGYA